MVVKTFSRCLLIAKTNIKSECLMCNLYRVIFNTFPCTLFESLETSLELITANVFAEPDELSFNSMLPTINQTNFVYFSSQVSRKKLYFLAKCMRSIYFNSRKTSVYLTYSFQ